MAASEELWCGLLPVHTRALLLSDRNRKSSFGKHRLLPWPILTAFAIDGETVMKQLNHYTFIVMNHRYNPVQVVVD